MKLTYRNWTKTPGIGGKILAPEDFIVTEVIEPKFLRKYGRTSRGIRKIEGKYSLYLLKKRNLTTREAVKRLARKLKLSENEIGYAGLKDRFAVTHQYLTIKDKNKKAVKEGGMELSFIKLTDKCIAPGDLIGNEFRIRLHGCSNIKNLEKIIKELKKAVPNYFGLQRFGNNKNNHIIGKLLVGKQFHRALKIINSNCSRAYKKIYEVPKRDLKFFVNAYQSWIFNEMLNNYIEKNKKPCFRSVELKAFEIPELRISCQGGTRKLFISIRDINFNIKGKVAEISFTLPKGSYATIVIKEISKRL